MISLPRYLDLSTSHVPERAAREEDFGDIRYAAHEHGWVLFIPSWESVDPGWEDDLPLWLLDIVRLAWFHGASLVNFDQDGECNIRLHVYDW